MTKSIYQFVQEQLAPAITESGRDLPVILASSRLLAPKKNLLELVQENDLWGKIQYL